MYNNTPKSESREQLGRTSHWDKLALKTLSDIPQDSFTFMVTQNTFRQFSTEVLPGTVMEPHMMELFSRFKLVP